jgi:hypothetical protein
MKESEQAELTKTVIDKVLASIKEPKTQQEILASAVAEVERKSSSSLLPVDQALTRVYRTCQEQGHLNVEMLCVLAYH